MSFDAVQYIKDQNEKEAANRVGAPKVEEPAKPVEAAVSVAETDDLEEEADETLEVSERIPRGTKKLPRRFRAKFNSLQDQLAETRGMLKAYQAMGKTPDGEEKKEPAPDPEAKPQRADFADEATYLEAIAAHAGRLEAAKSEQQRQWQDRLREMHAKAQEDIKLIPDYAEHAKAAEGDGPNAVEFTAAEHPTLMALIGTSEYQALAWDYFATHPDEFEEMLGLTVKNGNSTEQVAEFRALEGHLKRIYKTLKVKPADAKEPAKEPEPKPVKLPKPSESVATHGGSAPVGEPKPYLADGKTINPAWVARRNERDGARR